MIILWLLCYKTQPFYQKQKNSVAFCPFWNGDSMGDLEFHNPALWEWVFLPVKGPVVKPPSPKHLQLERFSLKNRPSFTSNHWLRWFLKNFQFFWHVWVLNMPRNTPSSCESTVCTCNLRHQSKSGSNLGFIKDWWSVHPFGNINYHQPLCDMICF